MSYAKVINIKLIHSYHLTDPTTTKCLYPANVNDDCILCPTATPWLHTIDGLCYLTCPQGFFGNTKLNQCRPCHSTCFTCTDSLATTCSSCTGSLFFNSSVKKCVDNCQQYGLTKSISVGNLCTTCKLLF